MKAHIRSNLEQGIALHRSQKTQEAEACYRQVLAEMPEQPDALYFLGVIQHAKGKHEKAIDKLQRSFRLKPRVEVAYNLSRILTQTGDQERAITALEDVLKLDAQHANAAFDLGLIYRNLGAYDQAISAFEKALSSEVHAQAALGNIGLCYQDIGELEKAREWFGRLTNAYPQHGLGWRQLASVSSFNESDAARIAVMQNVYENAQNERNRCNLAFALGKAHDDLGKYEQAFQYYAEGNRIKRKDYPKFTIDSVKARFAHIEQFFSPEHYAAMPSSTVEGSEQIIFITGMPRSSTTLVEQVLSSHPLVHGAGEVDFFHQMIAGLQKNLLSLTQADMNELASRYLAAIKQHCKTDAPYIVDKNLLNTPFIGFISKVLPQAKILHCKRNAADNCMSIFRQSFVGAYPFAYDLREIGQYYRLQERLVAHVQELLPTDAFCEVVYEDLVADVAAKSQELLSFCGLDWSDACLSFYETKRAVKTASAAQVRQPIYRTSLGMADRYGELAKPLKDILALE